jgi:hypothetical protein
VAIPAIVTAIQNTATHRLCPSTHRVTVAIIARSFVYSAHNL